jgi:integrase/recombinase XerC
MSSLQIVPRPPTNPPILSSDVIRRWLAGRGKHTTRNYLADLSDFARFLGASSSEAAAAMLFVSGLRGANKIAQDYRTAMSGRSLSTATIRRRLSALRTLVEAAGQEGVIEWSLKVKSPRKEKRLDMSGPTNEEWFKLRTTAYANARARGAGPRELRDLSLVLLMHDRALRRGECVSLDLEHAVLGGQKPGVWVVAKGKTEREFLEIPQSTADALADWIGARGNEPGPLFLQLDRGHRKRVTFAALGRPLEARRLTGESVNNMVWRLGRQAGLPRRTRPHGLRHHAATRYLEITNGNVRGAQKLLRDLDVRQVEAYDDARLDIGSQGAKLLAEDN